MHEFSIALSVVDIANEYAEKEQAEKINEIEIEIGELSGVVMEAFEFAMESAVKDTILEGARVTTSLVPGRARCIQCHHEYPARSVFTPCPECKSCAPDIVSGKELRVKSMLVD